MGGGEGRGGEWEEERGGEGSGRRRGEGRGVGGGEGRGGEWEEERGGEGRKKEGEEEERGRDEKGMGEGDRVYGCTHYTSNGPVVHYLYECHISTIDTAHLKQQSSTSLLLPEPQQHSLFIRRPQGGLLSAPPLSPRVQSHSVLGIAPSIKCETLSSWKGEGVVCTVCKFVRLPYSHAFLAHRNTAEIHLVALTANKMTKRKCLLS